MPANGRVDGILIYNQFHAQQGGNRLKIRRVIQLLLQAFQMGVIHLQRIGAVPVFLFKLLANVIDEAQHVLPLQVRRPVRLAPCD